MKKSEHFILCAMCVHFGLNMQANGVRVIKWNAYNTFSVCIRYNDHIISINPFLRINQNFGVNLIMLGVKETQPTKEKKKTHIHIYHWHQTVLRVLFWISFCLLRLLRVNETKISLRDNTDNANL